MEGVGDGDNARGEEERPVGLTPQVLDYYKRFGRHRDLEQYFSLTTAQGEAQDPVFWRSIKSQPDSDSGKSSSEVCRITINCTVADPSSSSQDGTPPEDSQDSNSPPIISEDVGLVPELTPPPEDDGGVKSDLDTSRKSVDFNLDNSLNKPHSPTSSINSQRKLEWDSLADVGYANENERKASASSLSTLERLALHQQFSLSDEIKNDNVSGNPTAHSTPLDEVTGKGKGKKNGKKSLLKKTTKISQSDVEVMEVNIDRGDSNIAPPNINFNLTKHISFNVDPKTGAASVSTSKTIDQTDEVDISSNLAMGGAVRTNEAMDKEVQTTLPRQDSEQRQEASTKLTPDMYKGCIATLPVLLNLDILKHSKYRALNYYRNKVKKNKRRKSVKQVQKTRKEKVAEQLEKSIPISEVTMGGSQVSEADSFEYMPAHIYQQNTARNNASNREPKTEASDKTSSLESSGGYTTHSSKLSEHSFTKDLEMSIALLSKLLQQRHQDGNIKKKLIKDLVQKLIRTNYRDDESATEFLSGLSFNSKLLGLGTDNVRYHNTTTSTSDGNSGDSAKHSRHRKSILRSSKSSKPTNPSEHSEHVVGKTNAQVHSPRTIGENLPLSTKSTSCSQTESVSKEKNISQGNNNSFPKTSSEQLYELYLKALVKEEQYKERLINKEELFRQNLTKKETIKEKSKSLKASSLKDLLNDLTKNSVYSAAGDSALQVDAVHSNPESDRYGSGKKMRSHSVFTISSGNSERKFKEPSGSNKKEPEKILTEQLVKRNPVTGTDKTCNLKHDRNTLPRTNKNLHYCCCPYHNSKDVNIDIAVELDSQSSSIGKNPAFFPEPLNESEPSDNAGASKQQHSRKKVTSESSGDVLSNVKKIADCNKFVCFCNSDGKVLDDIPDNFLIYKCSKMPHNVKSDSTPYVINKKSISVQCSSEDLTGSTQNENFSEERPNFNNRMLNLVDITPATSYNVITEPLRTASELSYLCMQSKVTGSDPVEAKTMFQKNPSKFAEDSNSDLLKSLKSRSDNTFSSGFELDAVRVRSNKQSARLTKEIHRKFIATQVDKNKSNLCVDAYMQTSVSIDPKISEPTLSDINVLHEENYTRSRGIKVHERANPTYDTKCIGGSACRCLRCHNIDAHANTAFIKPTEIGEQYQSPPSAYRDDQTLKRQKETNAILDAILQTKTPYEKSKESSTPLCTDELFAYLDAKISEDVLIQNVASEGINTDIVSHRDVETSMTDLLKEASKVLPTDSVKNKHAIQSTSKGHPDFEGTDFPIVLKSESSSRRQSDNISNSATSKSRGPSEQVTPRDEARTSEQEHFKSSDSSKSVTFPKEDSLRNYSEKITLHRNHAHSKKLENNLVEANTRKATDNLCFSENNEKIECLSERKSIEENSSASTVTKEVLMDSIKDIIKRYAKKDKPVAADKRRSRQKYYNEILNKLNYLLQTDGNTDQDDITSIKSVDTDEEVEKNNPSNTKEKGGRVSHIKKNVVDKSTQLRNSSSHCKLPRERVFYTFTRPHTNRMFVSEDSSDLPTSSVIPRTSSDSFTYQIIKRIKKECERAHQKQCQCSLYFEKLKTQYDASSSTSANRPKREGTNHGTSRSSHKCKSTKTPQETKKKSIAYNLIIQPSDSVIPDDNIPERDKPVLKDIIVKVPSRRTNTSDKTSQDYAQSRAQCELGQTQHSEPPKSKEQRDSVRKSKDKENSKSSSLTDTSDASCIGEPKIKFLTVREYLERNRPDFVDSTNERLSCLKVIQESRLRQQRVQRKLLSLRVERPADVTPLTVSELEGLARRFGEELRSRRPSAKFLSEREMKEHSRKIYKSLPEVVQKKEKHKKDQIKKTNMVISSLFNKNLQKKALRGTVNISHYSPVIKI